MLSQARRPAALQCARRAAAAPVAPALRCRRIRARAGEQPPSEPAPPAAAPASTATERPPAAAAAAAPAAAPAPPAAASPRGPRKKGGKQSPRMASAGPAGAPAPRPPQRQIPIKGMVNQPKQARPGEVDWKEGELFPEGWEQMDVGQKAYQLYMGKRGALFWMTQAAWYSAIILGVSWVLFRFVGPAVGLYSLKGDLLPTMM